jgi:hypothetical protein
MIDRDEKVWIIKFLTGEQETFCTVLVAILLRMYGPEVLNWDGATIQLQVKDDLHVEMPRRVYDQIMGLLSVLNTDAVYKDADVFDVAVAALSRQGLVFDNRSPTVQDVAWAVAEISMNDPDPVTRDPEQPWGQQIQRYARAVLDDEGMDIAPSVLSFVPDKTPTVSSGEDAADYTGTWGVRQAQADEIDQAIEDRFRVLLQHLQLVGVTVEGDLNNREAVATDGNV